MGLSEETAEDLAQRDVFLRNLRAKYVGIEVTTPQSVSQSDINRNTVSGDASQFS